MPSLSKILQYVLLVGSSGRSPYRPKLHLSLLLVAFNLVKNVPEYISIDFFYASRSENVRCKSACENFFKVNVCTKITVMFVLFLIEVVDRFQMKTFSGNVFKMVSISLFILRKR